MNRGPELQRQALAAGLLLSAKGERIHIESPMGLPLRQALRVRLATHRDELLRWLEWCETADVLLLETSARIAKQCPRGCPLDGAAWRAAEQVLRESHQSQDLTVFHQALVRYECFALSYFATHGNGATR